MKVIRAYWCGTLDTNLEFGVRWFRRKHYIPFPIMGRITVGWRVAEELEYNTR